MKTAIVLLSSGLDSTVNLFAALKNGVKVVRALTFDYGQRAARNEIAHSERLAQIASVAHEVVALPWLKAITRTSLVNTDGDVPTGAAVAIDDLETSSATARAVWVPNRNGVFLNVGAAFADSLKVDLVVPGFNAEEAATFPDNSADFLASLNHSFSFSTSHQVKVHCYTTELRKPEIYQLGLDLGVPMDLVWPCYFAGERPCGQCESCQRFLRAKAASGAFGASGAC
jgi:7-cyano-7-deazaguanine synthase